MKLIPLLALHKPLTVMASLANTELIPLVRRFIPDETTLLPRDINLFQIAGRTEGLGAGAIEFAPWRPRRPERNTALRTSHGPTLKATYHRPERRWNRAFSSGVHVPIAIICFLSKLSEWQNAISPPKLCKQGSSSTHCQPVRFDQLARHERVFQSMNNMFWVTCALTEDFFNGDQRISYLFS